MHSISSHPFRVQHADCFSMGSIILFHFHTAFHIYVTNWYKEISKFSKWHLSDQITLSIFIETKSHIPPKVKKNELWVEEELFSIEESILD